MRFSSVKRTTFQLLEGCRLSHSNVTYCEEFRQSWSLALSLSLYFCMVSTSVVLWRQRLQKWKELLLYLALRLGWSLWNERRLNFRTLHLVAIVLSLSSISNSSLTIPCVVISSVKSSYAPGFFPLINRTDFLSRSSRGTHDRKFPTTPEVSQMVYSVL